MSAVFDQAPTTQLPATSYTRQGFNKLVAESFTVLSVIGAQFRAAARFADQHALGLRAGDALHLAIASEHGITVHTLDQRLAEAGPALGVPAQLLA